MSGISSTNRAVVRRWAFTACSISFLLVAARGAADDTHYRGVPIGAHAIGLGGAFTGVADDVSAAYFNPAGLALSGTIGITGGLTINAWERFEQGAALDQPDGTADATDSFGRTVPIFIGATVKFGEKDEDGEAKNSLAVSVVEPIFSRTGLFLKFPSDPPELSDSYRVDQADRATWYGLSYARRFNSKHSFGASLYLSVRRLNHSEVGLALGGGMPVSGEPGTFDGTSTASNSQALNFKAFHFVPRVGWLYRIKPEVQLGVLLQLPGIPLKQRVDVFSQGFVNDNRIPPVTTTAYYLDETVDAKLPVPFELEAGVEYQAAEKVMLAFDASFHSPVPAGSRVGVDESVPVGGLFFSTDTQRLATGNVAIAGDFSISRKFSIKTGFFTDLSSAIKIPDDPSRYYNPRINRFGGTLSVGLNVGGISLAVGSTFIYGSGDATGVVVDAGNFASGYIKTDASSRLIYLHVTGATRAVVDLGSKAQHGIESKREKKKQEEE